jgi:hypothetical protein
MLESWRLTGRVLVACNCDWGCPCNFNARPTTGKCEGGWSWHVDQGSAGDVKLDGLNFSVFVNWPGAIHEGNGEGVILIDERADTAQRSAIEVLLGGKVGGPWGVLAWTWPKVHGPYATAYDLVFDRITIEMRRTRGDRAGRSRIRQRRRSLPGVVLPQGIIFKKGDLSHGASRSLTASNTTIQASTWLSANSITRGRKDAVRDGTR